MTLKITPSVVVAILLLSPGCGWVQDSIDERNQENLRAALASDQCYEAEQFADKAVSRWDDEWERDRARAENWYAIYKCHQRMGSEKLAHTALETARLRDQFLVNSHEEKLRHGSLAAGTDGSISVAWNYRSQQDADEWALNNCNQRAEARCEVETRFGYKECLAVAKSAVDATYWLWAKEDLPKVAYRKVLAACHDKERGCYVSGLYCQWSGMALTSAHEIAAELLSDLGYYDGDATVRNRWEVEGVVNAANRFAEDHELPTVDYGIDPTVLAAMVDEAEQEARQEAKGRAEGTICTSEGASIARDFGEMAAHDEYCRDVGFFEGVSLVGGYDGGLEYLRESGLGVCRAEYSDKYREEISDVVDEGADCAAVERKLRLMMQELDD